MARNLKAKFGDAVRVEYHDLADPAVREQNPDIEAAIRTQEGAVPVVYVDDQVVCQGYVSFWDIEDAFLNKVRRLSQASAR